MRRLAAHKGSSDEALSVERVLEGLEEAGHAVADAAAARVVVAAAGVLVVSLLLLQVLLDDLNVVVDLVQLLDDLLLEVKAGLAAVVVTTGLAVVTRAVVRGMTRVLRVRVQRGGRLMDGVEQARDQVRGLRGRVVRRTGMLVVRGARMLMVRGTRMLVVGRARVRRTADRREGGRHRRGNRVGDALNLGVRHAAAVLAMVGQRRGDGGGNGRGDRGHGGMRQRVRGGRLRQRVSDVRSQRRRQVRAALVVSGLRRVVSGRGQGVGDRMSGSGGQAVDRVRAEVGHTMGGQRAGDGRGNSRRQGGRAVGMARRLTVVVGRGLMVRGRAMVRAARVTRH